MEAYDYEFLGIPDLVATAKAMGVETLWFPIKDVDAPPPSAMPEFIEMVKQILARAKAGESVVIHCRRGLGKTGTVAAACLVALGHEPKEAIRRVRAVREGAVEPVSQVQSVEAFAASWSAQPSDHGAAPSVETFLGCLQGGALGDALGYPVEFDKGANILRRFGAKAPRLLNFDGQPLALISDDTQVTLFTAEGLTPAREFPATPHPSTPWAHQDSNLEPSGYESKSSDLVWYVLGWDAFARRWIA